MIVNYVLYLNVFKLARVLALTHYHKSQTAVDFLSFRQDLKECGNLSQMIKCYHEEKHYCCSHCK